MLRILPAQQVLAIALDDRMAFGEFRWRFVAGATPETAAADLAALLASPLAQLVTEVSRTVREWAAAGKDAKDGWMIVGTVGVCLPDSDAAARYARNKAHDDEEQREAFFRGVDALLPHLPEERPT